MRGATDPVRGLLDPTQDPLEQYRSTITSLMRLVPDFPRPGVLFQDITGVIERPEGLRAVVDGLNAICPTGFDKVAGIEARGFLFGSPLALAHDAGFVAVRKEGKLPGETLAVSYELEYGSATVEIPKPSVAPGDRILVVDDILATGGTAEAACSLVESSGGEVVGVVFLMEILGLGGRGRLHGRDVRTLVTHREN